MDARTYTYARTYTQAFGAVFDKAIDRAEPAEDVKGRVINLIDCITFCVFTYTTRGKWLNKATSIS